MEPLEALKQALRYVGPLVKYSMPTFLPPADQGFSPWYWSEGFPATQMPLVFRKVLSIMWELAVDHGDVDNFLWSHGLVDDSMTRDYWVEGNFYCYKRENTFVKCLKCRFWNYMACFPRFVLLDMMQLSATQGQELIENMTLAFPLLNVKKNQSRIPRRCWDPRDHLVPLLLELINDRGCQKGLASLIRGSLGKPTELILLDTRIWKELIFYKRTQDLQRGANNEAWLILDITRLSIRTGIINLLVRNLMISLCLVCDNLGNTENIAYLREDQREEKKDYDFNIENWAIELEQCIYGGVLGLGQVEVMTMEDLCHGELDFRAGLQFEEDDAAE